MKYFYAGQEIYPVVEIYHDLIPYIAGITEKQFYMDAVKCADAWQASEAALKSYFGAYCPDRVPGAAPLSYGHLISIGAPYTLLEDSEPNIKPFAGDIDEALEIVNQARGADYGAHPLCKHYVEVNRYLQSRFPSRKIPPLSGYGFEGVVTSAVLMRGQDVFIDIYEEPEKTLEFFRLLNESIIDFCMWSSRVNAQPPVSSFGSYLCDDFAALIPPGLWDEFVTPFWDKYYSARSTGSYRFLHCEGLSKAHLPYLEHAMITRFQPSVSEKLNLSDVKASLNIPFDWLLYAWKVTQMSDSEIQAWVDNVVEAGVFKIRTQIGKYAWMNNKQDRILAFMRAFDKYRVE
ncbi:MAG: hypothetical protein K5663_13080 [Clostridiales bacterium]|nr:hypothetical protein [Clostridiales bacterium]